MKSSLITDKLKSVFVADSALNLAYKKDCPMCKRYRICCIILFVLLSSFAVVGLWQRKEMLKTIVYYEKVINKMDKSMDEDLEMRQHLRQLLIESGALQTNYAIPDGWQNTIEIEVK